MVEFSSSEKFFVPDIRYFQCDVLQPILRRVLDWVSDRSVHVKVIFLTNQRLLLATRQQGGAAWCVLS